MIAQGAHLHFEPAEFAARQAAVIEAMALGVPTVAFAAGGLPEVIDDGINGVLVPPGDAARFVSAVTQLVVDAAARKRLADAGPERAREFSPVRMVDAVQAAYRDVLERYEV